MAGGELLLLVLALVEANPARSRAVRVLGREARKLAGKVFVTHLHQPAKVKVTEFSPSVTCWPSEVMPVGEGGN